jgi:hypothetical protein
MAFDIRAENMTPMMGGTNLAIHHPDTLIRDLKPDLAAQTDDEADVVL